MRRIFFVVFACMPRASGTEPAVTLSLSEFEELFQSARLAEATADFEARKRSLQAAHDAKVAKSSACEARNEAEASRQSKDALLKLSPLNYIVLSHDVSGQFNSSDEELSGIERDVATFQVELLVRVLTDGPWTLVPIVNASSVVASNWSAAWRTQADVSSSPSNASSSWLPVSEAEAEAESLLVLRDGQHVLATNRSGLYRVAWLIHSRVRRTRRLSSLSLSLLHPFSQLSIRIAGASPAIRDLSMQPPAVLRVREVAGEVQVVAYLTPTPSVELQWLAATAADAAKAARRQADGEQAAEASQETDAEQAEAEPAPQVTVSHDALHSVSDSVVLSTHHLVFSSSAPLTTLPPILLHGHGRARVTSVAAHGLAAWHAEAVSAGADSMPEGGTRVRAAFKSSHLETSSTVIVFVEQEVSESSHSELHLASIECDGVLRMTGRVGVAKEASIEIHPLKLAGLSPADPGELASQLRLNTASAIVLAYKYLSPKNTLALTVLRHRAIETLEAAVDRAHYRVLQVESHAMHLLTLTLQTTNLQYLAVRGLPASAASFVLLVNSIPTKPVESSEGIRVPLLVGGGDGGDGAQRTSVELSYLSRNPPLGHNGTALLPPPQLSVPVSALSVELILPRQYEYNFSGSFGNQSLAQLDYALPKMVDRRTAKKVVRQAHRFSEAEDAREVEATAEEGPGRQAAGGIKVSIPKNAGRSFLFQRLLVVDEELVLRVNYAPPSQQQRQTSWSYWRRRA